MRELISFFNQHTALVIIIVAMACVLFGRIWSNILNWGTITEPHSMIRSGRSYKVINLYLPKGWTDSWEVGSIICLETFRRGFFKEHRKEIYVSGDRIRFAEEDGPGIGRSYKASFSNKSTGSIVMKPIKQAK